ncbi:hypothetical protein VUR80DRAFT_1345 [Thermomyces stellatus]
MLERARRGALSEAVRLATEICEGGPVAVRSALKAVAFARPEMENKMYERIVQTEDRDEALKAFQEKRKPVFKGSIARTVPRVASRAATAHIPRAFTTTARQHGIKDNLKAVDRKVSDKIVDGIDIGAAVANKVKQAGSDVTKGKATGDAAEIRDEAEQEAREGASKASGKASDMASKAGDMAGKADTKVNEMANEASGKTSEMAGEAKGKASELAGEAKGKAKDVGGKVKSKTEELKGKAGATTGNPT